VSLRTSGDGHMIVWRVFDPGYEIGLPGGPATCFTS
jgi:hypothetical protein